jgi:uncharacterized RDD family membrane protein YckC
VTQFIDLPPSLRGHYAGFVTRSIAFTLDLLLVVITQMAIILFARLLLNFFGLDELSAVLFEPAEPANTSPIVQALRWVITIFASGVLAAIYFVFFWVLVDKTLGQALLGLRVIRTDGRSISLGFAIRRALGYYVSFIALGLGFLWVLIDDRRQGWHDKLADTVVVYDWNARLGRRVREWLARQQESHGAAAAASPAEPPSISSS